MNLETLVAEVETQQKAKADYVTPQRQLFFSEGKLLISGTNKEITYNPSPLFHRQVSEKLKIPKTYYDRMLTDSVALLDQNVNHWFQNNDGNVLIRTFENKMDRARALLSDRYGMIDNFEVLYETLQAIQETGINVEVKDADLTDLRLYLRVVAPEVEVEAKKLLQLHARSIERGSGIISGFILSNSEVGCGKFSIAPRAVVLACNNGMIRSTEGMSRVHLGGKMDELDFDKNANVQRANLKLIKEQVKHAVKRFLSKEYLIQTIEHFERLGTPEIQAPITQVLEVIAKDYQITEQRKANLLNHFIKGADTRRIGLFNALTEEAQELDADLKYETEIAATDILSNFSNIEARAIQLSRSSN